MSVDEGVVICELAVENADDAQICVALLLGCAEIPNFPPWLTTRVVRLLPRGIFHCHGANNVRKYI